MTGEGSLDHSTVYNKAPVGVAARAKKLGIPVVAVSGSLGQGYHDLHHHGIDAACAITYGPMTLEEASGDAANLITCATEEALLCMKVGAKVFGGK